jgi:excisionase family DNA binding protein
MNDQTLVLFNRYRAETGDVPSAAMLVLAHALLNSEAKPLTVAEAAKRKGVSKDLIYRMVNEGQLRARRTGRTIRILPEDLDAA